MRVLSSLLAIAALFASTAMANATVQVAIDLTHQRMHVDSNEGTFDWPISSARSGFYTPGGSFAPTHLELMHYSKKYHMSPMPHAIFFRGGYAIHGTYSTASLGRPASHGCVRLSPDHAATLYDMVENEGARISISGAPPASRQFDAEREGRVPRRRDADALARIAPLSNDSTVDEDYGDAAYARRRAYRQARAYAYQQQPQYYGYRPGYPYAPAYTTAPQVLGGYAYQQSPLVPGFGE